MDLNSLGLCNFTQESPGSLCLAEYQLARVTIVDRDRFIVCNEQGEINAVLTGKLSYESTSPEDLPCVGDWVCIQLSDDNSLAGIHHVLPRKSSLRRKAPGKNIEYQMIAANIDIALIVQSCHFDFNINRLERYLLMVTDGQIEPVIVLTKTDLVSQTELEQLITDIRASGIHQHIICISNLTGDGIADIKTLLLATKTCCLVGSSGVGKSSLINLLAGDSHIETKAVSHTGEGRHTTVRRQLHTLENGALLIDTPGMRELALIGASDTVNDTFVDIQELSRNCKFNNCSHTNEPGCAVQSALQSGELNEKHYNNYVKLKKETEFYDMSYSEKRKKDKDFGRYVKSVVKHLNKH